MNHMLALESVDLDKVVAIMMTDRNKLGEGGDNKRIDFKVQWGIGEISCLVVRYIDETSCLSGF